MSEYVVDLMWDSEAAVWIATSSDVPGLILESGSYDALIERVRFAALELLALNGVHASGEIMLRFQTERREQAYADG
jgi:hypothetical protein